MKTFCGIHWHHGNSRTPKYGSVQQGRRQRGGCIVVLAQNNYYTEVDFQVLKFTLLKYSYMYLDFYDQNYLSSKLRQRWVNFSAQECILQRATLKVAICQTSSFIFSFFIPCKYVDNSHFPDYWSVQIKETDTKNTSYSR